jgi:hypothetical protein
MDELSQRARALLDHAQFSDEPSEDDRLRVHRSVLLRVGGAAAITAALTAGSSGTAAAAAPAAAGTTLFGSALLKIGAAVALVGGITSGAYFVSKSKSMPEPQPSAVIAAPAKPSAPAPETPVVAADELATEPETESAKVPAKERSTRVPTRKTSTDLDAEVALLREADAALRRGDSKAALAALATHAHDFPRGALAQEREGVRAIALCRGGRLAEGIAKAQRFVNSAPKSPLGTRIRSACFPDK